MDTEQLKEAFAAWVEREAILTSLVAKLDRRVTMLTNTLADEGYRFVDWRARLTDDERALLAALSGGDA